LESLGTEIWEYYVVVWYITWSLGKLRGGLVYSVVIYYILERFGMFFHEKSGNPGLPNF
jgi:hypothetical protein